MYISPVANPLPDMTQSKKQHNNRRESFGDAYPPSPKTLRAMQEMDLSIQPADSEGLGDLSNESPPGISMASRRSRTHSSGEDVIMPTRLRTNIQTTPKASQVMHDASSRRALQQPSEDSMDNPFISPGTPPTGIDNMFSTPHTPTTEFEEVPMAPPSSPLQPLQEMTRGIDRELSFVFPTGPGMAGYSDPYAEQAIWNQYFGIPKDGSDGVGNTVSAPGPQVHWPFEPPGLPSQRGPPMPVYATKPQHDMLPQNLHPSLNVPQQLHESHITPHYAPTPTGFYHSNQPPPQPEMHVIPPTPYIGKGKQRAEALPVPPFPTRPSMPSLTSVPSSFPSSSMLSSVSSVPTPISVAPSLQSRAKGKQSDDKDFQDVGPATPTRHEDSEMCEILDQSSGSEGWSPPDKTVSSTGRMKDVVLTEASKAYETMDLALRAITVKHPEISFARLLKSYFKRHNIKSGGANSWNLYEKMHARPTHQKIELARVGCTVDQFNELSLDAQQRIRKDCYRSFVQSYDTMDDCRHALDVFHELCSVEEKEQGTNGVERRKLFNAVVNRMAKVVSLFTVIIIQTSH